MRNILRAVWRNVVTGLVWTGFSYGFVPLGLPSVLAAARPGGVLPGDEPHSVDDLLDADDRLDAGEPRCAGDRRGAGVVRPLKAEWPAHRPLTPAEEEIWVALVTYLRRSA
jgi:hypothetical protein